MVKQFLQSVAFHAGRLEMLGTIKPLTGPGLLCGQQNRILGLRITCQRLISITWKVPMEALYSSLWGVNSTNKCSNRFFSHCKWVSIQLTEWGNHSAVSMWWCYRLSQELHLHAVPYLPVFPWPHSYACPACSFAILNSSIWPFTRHVVVALTNHAVLKTTPGGLCQGTLQGSQRLVLSNAAPSHSLFRSLLSALPLPAPHLPFLALFSLQSFEVWIYKSFPRDAL